MARFDFPKPWRAEPMDPRDPGDGWQVVSASSIGPGKSAGAVVATYLTEQDARDIVEGVNAFHDSRRNEPPPI